MGKAKIDLKIVREIHRLRARGYSISEICQVVNKSKSVVSRYIQGVSVLPKYEEILSKKQGGSIFRSQQSWIKSREDAEKIIGNLNDRDKLIFLAGLYWGEGTKKELNIINGDPFLLKVFTDFITTLNISKERIKVSLRLYEDIDYTFAVNYWCEILDIKSNQFYKPEILKGRKKGKLKFGMCRIRIEKSAIEFKLLMSLIDVIKVQQCSCSSMDRIAHS